jgi:heme/copper-type cytochrome/quinol oxidase subunit 2
LAARLLRNAKEFAMMYLLAQAATDAAASEKNQSLDLRSTMIWVAAALIVGVLMLAIWAMTRARTPLVGDHH